MESEGAFCVFNTENLCEMYQNEGAKDQLLNISRMNMEIV